MTPVRKSLSVSDGVAMIVGIVVGAGIYKTPSLVASGAGTEWASLGAWVFGGIISLVGCLCYSELASTYPHSGGDYHYIARAYGSRPAFLFAWARMTVIQTGSIAMLAFLVGDYASEVYRLGDYSSSYYAALIIVSLTLINIAGIHEGKRLQEFLMAANLLGILLLLAAGFALAGSMVDSAPSFHGPLPDAAGMGRAMIFVLLTYGGWNEAAYLSAEIRDPHRNMFRVLIYSIAIITAIYLLMNYVFFRGLGFAAVSGSETVAADLMRRFAGNAGARFISILIVLSVLTTMNAMIITGARTNYALGLDYRFFAFLGRWRERSGTPVNALLAQGIIALFLVSLGTAAKSGFVSMVEYTAPVFWLFFLLVGISVIVLRRKEPRAIRPFRIPLYPFTPILFCFVCAYMFQSSVSYTGNGALFGLGVLLAGLPFLLLRRSFQGEKIRLFEEESS